MIAPQNRFGSQIRALTFFLIFQASLACGQRIEPGTGYWYEGIVTHEQGKTTVSANEPRPLRQAVEALAQEYGWTVDYEDPVYSEADAIERTDLAFLASHPAEKQHLVLGHRFKSEFPDSTTSGTSVSEEKAILQKVIDDYNKSGNPGKFTLLDEGGGRFAVVGTNAGGGQAPGILESLISIDGKATNGSWVLTKICDTLTSTSGLQVRLLQYPLNVLVRTQVNPRAENERARDILRDVLSQAPQKLMWSLLYDIDDKTYYLNLLPVIKVTPTLNGKINQWVR